MVKFCFYAVFVKVPDDWDLVKTSDVRKMSPTHSLLTASTVIIDSLSKTMSSVTKAIGLYLLTILQLPLHDFYHM